MNSNLNLFVDKQWVLGDLVSQRDSFQMKKLSRTNAVMLKKWGLCWRNGGDVFMYKYLYQLFLFIPDKVTGFFIQVEFAILQWVSQNKRLDTIEHHLVYCKSSTSF